VSAQDAAIFTSGSTHGADTFDGQLLSAYRDYVGAGTQTTVDVPETNTEALSVGTAMGVGGAE
jgi:hypothetical protein